MISRADADLIRSVTGRVIGQLRAGAQSAETAPADSGLTYADGWHAAATLAGLVSADAMRDAIAARAMRNPRGPDWHPRE
jgi:hypothetical protein